MARFYIEKSDGSKEYFQDRKLLGSLLKTSLGQQDAESVVAEVKKEVRKGITTSELRNITFQKLCKTHLPHAQLYNLRESLAALPPKVFEKYVKKILETDGYTCEWETIVTGAGTRHEVDVVAKKGKDFFLIECKRRSNWHKPSGLGKVMVVRARIEDIIDGNKKGKNKYPFTRAWVINNAKFSAHAKEYAQYKGIWLTGWNYPKDKGLNEWIQHLQVYPITMLRLQKREINSLLQAGVHTFNDFEVVEKDIAQKILSSNSYASAEKQIRSIKQCTL